MKYLKIQKNHKKEKEISRFKSCKTQLESEFILRNKSYFDIVAICNFAQNFWKAEIDSSFGKTWIIYDSIHSILTT